MSETYERENIKPRADIVRRKAVRWLSPSELTSAALRVGLSAAFGEYADKREIVGMVEQPPFDYSVKGSRSEIQPSQDEDELWVDFVSDTGDGFAATYAVASKLADRELLVTNDNGDISLLPRGQLLVHGGDLVYPTATTSEYEERFTGPYKASLPYTKENHPHFFAIPGNHDWYDGLTSFVRMFCESEWLGGRKVPQTRSYFSIKLSEHWWIWGIDIQFDGFIDKAQLDYFLRERLSMGTDAGIILVSAKPSWAFVHEDDKEVPTKEMHNLDYFVKTCVYAKTWDDPKTDEGPVNLEPVNVRMMLSGDIHHYARYKDSDNDVTYLTAGGGGAYLSLTHHLLDKVVLRRETKNLIRGPEKRTLDLVEDSVYPTREWSKSKRSRAVFAGLRNPSFAALLGSIYLILALLALRSLPGDGGFSGAIEAFSDEPFWTAFKSIVGAGMTSPGNIVMFGVFAWILVKYTRSKDLVVSLLAGGTHALVHIGGLFLSLTALSRLTPEGHPVVSWFIYVVGLFLLGLVVGSVIFGLYLVVADMRGLHPNDGYTAQRIEHKKNFLRMRVTPEMIEFWGIGLDYVPPAKAWQPSEDPDTAESPDLTLTQFAEGKEFTHKQVDYFWIDRIPDGNPNRPARSTETIR